MKRNYGKRLLFFFFFAAMCAMFSGCGEEAEEIEKIRDLDYTVLEEGNVPKELLEKIKEKKREIFEMTYELDGYLYIAKGYGTQPTSGYSVRVLQVYEADPGIVFSSELLGPAKEEPVLQVETYPYIVIKLPAMNMEVIFW